MEFTCSRCGLTYCGILIGTTPICEDCFNELHNELMEDKGMTFTEAIQKYKMITNDGGKTHYYVSGDEGTIYRRIGNSDISGSVNASLQLLTSTGWGEYKDKELILPKAVNYGVGYHTITSWGSLVQDRHLLDHTDKDKLEAFNYFTDKKFAQYVLISN